MQSRVNTPDNSSNAGIADRIYLSALVPVYNEAGTIEEIVQLLEQISIIHQIVVVDDGSLDETPAIVKRLSDARRVVAYFHERNYGKGAALRHALELAQEGYLVIQDADLEYDPQDFIAMARLVQETGAQVVYGSRFLRGGIEMKSKTGWIVVIALGLILFLVLPGIFMMGRSWTGGYGSMMGPGMMGGFGFTFLKPLKEMKRFFLTNIKYPKI